MKRDWWDKEFRKLVTLGESTTAGGWASRRERCWANLLAAMIGEYQRVPVQLVNAGIGANLISDRSPSYEFSGRPAASERIEKHVIAQRPDLLLIAYGLNDSRGGTPLDLFLAEMSGIIERVRRAISPLIALISPFYIHTFEYDDGHWNHGSLALLQEFGAAIEGLATELDCLYVDVLSAYHEADWLVHHDGVHPNDLGHRVIASRIFEVLAGNCSGLALETKYLEHRFEPWRDESTLKLDDRSH